MSTRLLFDERNSQCLEWDPVQEVVRITVRNGWARYRAVKWDTANQQVYMECIEYWGPDLEDEDESRTW